MLWPFPPIKTHPNNVLTANGWWDSPDLKSRSKKRCAKPVPTRSETPPGFKGSRSKSLRWSKSFFNLNTFIGWHLISRSETTQAFSMSIKLGCDSDDTLKETCFDSNSEVLEIAFAIGSFL